MRAPAQSLCRRVARATSGVFVGCSVATLTGAEKTYSPSKRLAAVELVGMDGDKQRRDIDRDADAALKLPPRRVAAHQVPVVGRGCRAAEVRALVLQVHESRDAARPSTEMHEAEWRERDANCRPGPPQRGGGIGDARGRRRLRV